MLYRYGTDSNGKLVKKAVIYTKEEHKIPLENIDKDALQIIHRLKESGYTAYIVGGAVRDLIVGTKAPKDFDIVTDATPSKIKRIFRNSRIIGKRFRLVHVVFGTKIFEVSTFRSNAEGSVGNEFGTIEQDVLRRDFSINALYPILIDFNALIAKTNVDEENYVLLLKIIGIGYISEYSASLCSDLNCESIAKKIIFAGKIFVFILAIPIIKKVFDLLMNII